MMAKKTQMNGLPICKKEVMRITNPNTMAINRVVARNSRNLSENVFDITI
jgi:hypothetical protein